MGVGCFPTLRRRFERANASRWPWGHLAGWRGPSGFGSRTVAAEVLPRPAAGAPLAGRVAIVTGANSGIGLETARALALGGGARVVLACRDPTAAARAAEDVRAENPYALVTVLPSVPLDLASFASVRAFADAFLALELPLHILVHNAGVMPCPFQLTADGHGARVPGQLPLPATPHRASSSPPSPRRRQTTPATPSSPAASSTSSPPRTSTPTRAACV